MQYAGEGCGVRSCRPETRIPAVTIRPAAERRDGIFRFFTVSW